jgi:2-iminobutanoate/2-iminopropanoate deaminase
MPVERKIIEPKNEKLNVSRNFNLPHSPGIRAGDFIFLSGMLSTDPNTGERDPGTMAHETRQTLTNMRHLLESAGSSLERVVKLNVLIYDMLEFENMNGVFKQFFPADPPARTVCGVQLSAGMKIEIECIALVGQ